jgi:hypothetical protein
VIAHPYASVGLNSAIPAQGAYELRTATLGQCRAEAKQWRKCVEAPNVSAGSRGTVWCAWKLIKETHCNVDR